LAGANQVYMQYFGGRWGWVLLFALLLGAGRAARAQPAAPPPNMALMGNDPARAAYPGPAYPGGPDSLRAAVQRHLRGASPELAGQLFLRLELDSLGFSRRAYFLAPPPGSPAIGLYLNPEVQNLTQQLVQLLHPWLLPATLVDQGPGGEVAVTIPLDFGPAPTPTVLAYSDENPTFSVVPLPRLGYSKGIVPSNLQSFFYGQIRYPTDDLRLGRQGTIYAYFEVSETGRVEQRRIVGTLSPTFDAEVLRVLRRLPSALTPPRQQGRPVRVGYVLPLYFRLY